MESYRKITRIFKISRIERKFLFKSLILLVFFTLVIRFLKLKQYKRLLIDKNFILNNKIDPLFYIRIIKKSINRIVQYIPMKFSCLAKSLTLKTLLYSLHIDCSISISVAKSHYVGLRAHSTIKRNNKVIFLELKN